MPADREAVVRMLQSPAENIGIGPEQVSVLSAKGSQVVGQCREANEPVDSIARVHVPETETIEVDECEVVARCGGTHENVSGVVVIVLDATIVLGIGVTGKLGEQSVGVGILGIVSVQQGCEIVVLLPVAADIVAVGQARGVPVLDACDGFWCSDSQFEELLRVAHGTKGFAAAQVRVHEPTGACGYRKCLDGHVNGFPARARDREGLDQVSRRVKGGSLIGQAVGEFRDRFAVGAEGLGDMDSDVRHWVWMTPLPGTDRVAPIAVPAPSGSMGYGGSIEVNPCAGRIPAVALYRAPPARRPGGLAAA